MTTNGCDDASARDPKPYKFVLQCVELADISKPWRTNVHRIKCKAYGFSRMIESWFQSIFIYECKRTGVVWYTK